MPAPVDYSAAPTESGRSYAFAQMLARSRERNAALEQQLEEQGQQIVHLHAEVEQLRQHEGELQAALQHAGGDGDGAAARALDATAPPTAERPPQRPPDEAEAPPAVAAQPPSEPLAAQAHAAQPPAAEASGAAPEPGVPPAVVASLRAELVQEQERRQAAESELERLKEETSSPPLADGGDTAAQLAAAKEEISGLRSALADERVQRERMADDLRVLQQRAEHAPQPQATPEDAELRARLAGLQAEKEAIMESFNRSLAASQQRTAELERQLAALHAVSASAGAAQVADADSAAVRAENQALRARLDEEHQRTEELAAKLRVATRVTDLIFKMQAQQAQPAPQPLQSP